MPQLLEVIGPKSGSAPLQYTVTEQGTVDLMSIFASFDGSAASGAFRPTVTIRAQNGTILARVFPSTTLATGDTADVTYAPFLDDGSGGGLQTVTNLVTTVEPADTLELLGGPITEDTAGTATLVLAYGDGWVWADYLRPPVNDWIYVSANSFKVVGHDWTTVMQKGTKIRVTQTTDKFFVVTDSVLAAGDTTVTLTGGSDYSLVNAPITIPLYSYAESPQTWPEWFNYTPTLTGYSGTPTVTVARFNVKGRLVTAKVDVTGTSDAATLTITPPVPVVIGGIFPATIMDNGVQLTTPGRVDLGGSVFRLGKDFSAAGGFTAANTKAAIFSFFYEMA